MAAGPDLPVTPGPTREKPPRDRMVLAAAKLFRTQGVTGTGLREIVARADAPRGSLQHYFPGGKEQIITEALQLTGDFAGRRVIYLLERLDQPTPGNLFAAFAGEWRDLYLREGFAQGCPLASAAVDSAAASAAVRGALTDAFGRWQQPLQEALRGLGVPVDRARGLATLMITALEGALILARSTEDPAVIDTVIEELRPLLDASVTQPKARRRRAPARQHTEAQRTPAPGA